MTDWLVGTLLATSGLILLVLLVREPVRKHFGARIAYGLWLIPTARLLMPTLTETIERPVAPTIANPMTFSQQVAEPLLMARVSSGEPSLIEQAGGWSTIAMVLWLGVAAGLFVARMIAFRRERGAILRNAEDIDRIGTIRLVQSAEVSGPLAFGIFDRVIAVPTEFWSLYDERERRLALEHELAHHRSGDLIANLAAFGLLCLQWFNPLAWMAHAAFRFDQEAACDARVLEKIRGNRSDYGRAIAKAASGRALLFASALDRRKTLHRRLKSMLSNPTAGRRTTGRVILFGAIAVALPLTATRAVEYIDVPMLSAASPAPAAPAAPKQPVPPAAVAAVAAVQPAAQAAQVHSHSNLNITDDMVTIDGKTMRWEEMSPAEKARVRAELAKAREELRKVNTQEIQAEVRRAMAEAQIDKDEMRRELASARKEIDEAMREIDANAADIRRSGQNPENIKAMVRASLKSVEAIDVEAITRQAMASIHPATIEAALAGAEEGLSKAEAELARLEAKAQKD